MKPVRTLFYFNGEKIADYYLAPPHPIGGDAVVIGEKPFRVEDRSILYLEPTTEGVIMLKLSEIVK